MADGDELLDSWLTSEMGRNPVLATELGLDGYDDRLGDFSVAAFESQHTEDRLWAGRFDRLKLDELALDARIDVALVLSHLAGRAVMEDWVIWRRDPATYLDPCLEGVFSLFLHRLRPEPELAGAAAARLREVPAVLAAGRANLDGDLASRLIVERGLGACRAGIAYFRELLPAELADHRLRADVAEAGALAADALVDFAAFLEDLAAKARGEWAIGETRYSGLLRQQELLGYGATEMHARGLTAWNDLDAELTSLSATVDPDAASWHHAVAALAREHPGSTEEMLASYGHWCEVARDFLVERELVTLPDGEECLVEPSPVFQRPVLAVASYAGPPPFSTSTTGHFFVPYPPAGTTAEALEERLADNGYHAIPTVTVHEAYPGHHWQLSWSNRTPRRVRKVVRTSYFLEGWALYAEKMMREQGFFADARQELCHLDARIFRAARIVVDTALHSGEMTFEQAVTFMSTRATLPEEVARAEVGRYCSWPTQAASYLTGSLEIERLRDRWMAERGGLRAFHDALGSSPGLPIALAELSLFGQ